MSRRLYVVDWRLNPDRARREASLARLIRQRNVIPVSLRYSEKEIWPSITAEAERMLFEVNSPRPKGILARVYLLTALFFLSGCGISGTIRSLLGTQTSLTGSVVPLQSGGAQNTVVTKNAAKVKRVATVSTCPSAKAYLYKLGSTGAIIQPPVSAVDLGSDGSYSFSNVQSLGVVTTGTKINGSYLVQVLGCNTAYSRIVTGLASQDITFGSSLVSYVLSTAQASSIANADQNKVNQLISLLETYNSYSSAYTSLVGSAANSQLFESITGAPVSVLVDAWPTALSISVPTSAREGESVSLTIDAAQWKIGYPYGYVWELDGQLIAATSNATYQFSKNMQGSHVISVFYGQLDSSNQFDQTKPYNSQNFTIQVSDDYPVQAPVLSVVGLAETDTGSIALQIATGASLSGCATFSALAITEDSEVPPLLPTAYNLTCSQAPTQNLTYTISSGMGTKVLSLWAIDSSGNVSAVPSQVSVVYGTFVPQLAITAPTNATTVPGTITLTGTCGSSDGDVTISGDVLSAPLVTACSSGTFSKSLQFTSPDGSKTIVASQTNAFHTGSATGTYTRDTGTPFSNLAINPSSPGKNPKPTVTGNAEAAATISLFGQSGCSGTALASTTAAGDGTFSLTPGSALGADGTYTLSVLSVDLVGNSLCSSSLTYVLDTAAPTVTLTSTAPAYTNVSPVPISVSFSEAVTGFSGSSLTLVNASVSGFSGSGTSYTFNLVPSGQGLVSAAIAAGAVQDAALNGNVASNPLSRTFDSVSPALTTTSPANNSYSNQSSFTINGTCEVGLAITLGGSGLLSPATASCSSSPFNLTVTPTAGDGLKNLTFSQTDLAGNTTSVNLAINLLTSAPVMNFTSAAVQNQISTSNTAVFTGSCKSGLSVVISGADTSTTACSGSLFSYATATQTSDASRSYTFTQTDQASNTASITGTWIRDTTLPVVSLTSLNAGGIIASGSTQTITWTATDANLGTTPVTLSYSTNSGTSWVPIASAIANSGSYSWTVPSINTSTGKVKVTVVDQAGNIGTASSTSTFTVDSTPPSVTLTSLNSLALFAGGSTQSITWTATSSFFGATPISLSYSADGGSTWTAIVSNLANSGSYSWTLPSLNGSNFKVKVTATDSQSLVGSAVSANSFAVDSTAPSASLTSLTGGQTVAGGGANEPISWTASDANLTSTPISLWYSANGGSTWISIASGLANSGTYVWSTTGLTDGTTYRIKLVAVDSVGHSTTVASATNFTLTSVAPNLTQTLLASPYITVGVSTVTFGGACDLSGTMQTTGGFTTNVTVGGTDSATVPCNGSSPTGSWTYTTAAQSTDGSRTYTFSQTNGASVTNTISATWLRDGTPPVVSSVVVNSGATYLNTPMASVQVTASDATTGIGVGAGLSVQIAATTATDANGDGASCQAAYGTNSWQAQTNATMTYSVLVSSSSGYKKICAWAKDGAGNVSTITTNSGAGNPGVDMGVIQLANASPPQITAFSVTNASNGTTTYAVGDNVSVTWTATDALGLANNPVSLDYTTNGSTWTNIVNNYGSLAGNPQTYTSTYLGFNAPSAGFFRLRLRVTNETGQTSATILSGIQNTGQWSTYAGTTDRGIGGAAPSAVFYKSDGARKSAFAFDPQTGDLYAFDEGYGGLLKTDAHTGLVSQFMAYGTTNLPTSTTLTAMPANPKFGGLPSMIAFDSKRNMYILEGNIVPFGTSARVFQVNLNTNQVRLYLGGTGASGYTTGTAPTSMYVAPTDMTFDEANNLYFITNCSMTVIAPKLMRISQNADGSAGTFQDIAGNCSQGAPSSGSVATSTPLNVSSSTFYYSITAWNSGQDIYYSDGNYGTYKIIGTTTSTAGTLYGTSIPAVSGLVYSAATQRLYGLGTAVWIESYTPHTTGAGGETDMGTYVTGSGTGAGCSNDGTAASANCGGFYGGAALNQQGQLFFGAGAPSAPTRIRYVDSSGLLRTFAGSLPFFGSGLNKGLIRGSFGGLYFKQATESNQAAFPAGLYFYEFGGGVIGYINDGTGITSTLVGAQNGLGAGPIATGTALTSGTSIGNGVSALTFDSTGLPWFVYSPGGNNVLISSIDANQKMVAEETGGNYWDYATDGTSPANTQTWIINNNNLQIKNKGAIMLNRLDYAPVGANSAAPFLRFLDFTGSTLGSVAMLDIMGGTGTTSSPDTTVAGSLSSFSFSSTCVNNGCREQYIPVSAANSANDLFYFAEGSNLRYITNPTTPTASLLTTAFTAATTINNFILSLDQTKVFYTMNSHLYCHTLNGTAKSWCNDTSLGPPSGMNTIGSVGNQFTWKSSTSLLISDDQGDIYEYDLLP